MSLTVITVVADRADHLRHLVAGLGRSHRPADELVVVDMGSSDDPGEVISTVGSELAVRWVRMDVPVGASLPLAAARNAGAAIAGGDDLVFLDVDCIPSAGALGDYESAIGRGGLVCGSVRYLQRFWDRELVPAPIEVDRVLTVRSSPNPARPIPSVERVGTDHELFWSLAFGLSRSTWEQIGGFDETYVGYGAEDTDFGFTARAAGVPLRWMPGGLAFHQFHHGWSPPRHHLHAIVANALRFFERWGTWPMGGWLAQFAREGLVDWDRVQGRLTVVGELAPPVRLVVASVPASHPYTRAVYHDHVEIQPDPAAPWWPHPVLADGWPQHSADGVDAVHVHFGFEHRSAAQLDRWCRQLAATGTPLVVTVHDLVDPHAPGGSDEHARRLAVLLDAAVEVITLTPSAARRIESSYGRVATVIPHPVVLPPDLARPRRSGALRVGMHFKAFRPNISSAEDVLPSVAAAVSETGADLVVAADAHADPLALEALRRCAAPLGIEPRIRAHMDDAELTRFIAGLDVLVLPYRHGTHSGMIEACRDMGTRPVVPARDSYSDQWSEAVTCPLRSDGTLDQDGLRDAVVRAVGMGRPASADVGWRAVQLAEVRDAHDRVIEAAIRRGPRRPTSTRGPTPERRTGSRRCSEEPRRPQAGR